MQNNFYVHTMLSNIVFLKVMLFSKSYHLTEKHRTLSAVHRVPRVSAKRKKSKYKVIYHD